MRERLSRGKREDNGEWVYGGYWKINNSVFIVYDNMELVNGQWIPVYVEVMPETIGDYIGVTDKNGKKIFEGDIVKYAERLWRIAWSTSNFTYMCIEENGDYWEWLSNMDKIEVIGNIHDNLELL